MPIGVYFSPASMNLDQYNEIMADLESANAFPAKGCLSHVCFGDNGELRVFDIWETREDFEHFGQKLMPIIEKAGVNTGAPFFVDIHNFVTDGPVQTRVPVAT